MAEEKEAKIAQQNSYTRKWKNLNEKENLHSS